MCTPLECQTPFGQKGPRPNANHDGMLCFTSWPYEHYLTPGMQTKAPNSTVWLIRSLGGASTWYPPPSAKQYGMVD